MKLFATVRKIKLGKITKDNNWKDEFCEGMQSMIGKEFEFEIIHVSGFAPSWYVDIKTRWTFHKSWLENFRLEK